MPQLKAVETIDAELVPGTIKVNTKPHRDAIEVEIIVEDGGGFLVSVAARQRA